MLYRGGSVVGIKASSTQTCEVPLSGAKLSGPQVLQTKQRGSEVVSLISSSPGVSISLSPSPVPI